MKLIWLINIFFIAGTFNFLLAQIPIRWNWGGPGNETLLDLKRSSNYFIVSGYYNRPFEWGNYSLNHQGGDDFYLAALDDKGNPVWIKNGGSLQNDKIAGIAISKNNDIAIAGSYWGNLNFSGFSLETENHPKEGFVSIFSEEGKLKWAKTIKGSSSKEITSLTFLENQNLCLTGYFSDTMYIDSITIIASGVLDGFYTCLDDSGKLIHLGSFGGSGNVFSQKMVTMDSNSIFIAGNFDGSIKIDEDSISSNTKDDDIFILKLKSNGQKEWLKKAGGVHTDNITSANIDHSGILVLGGTFVGTLAMENTIALSSDEGFGDGFLIGISSDGKALWGKKLGGSNLQTVRTLSEDFASGLFFRRLTAEGGFDFSSPKENPQFFNLKFNRLTGAIEKLNVFENFGNYFPNTSLVWEGSFFSGGSFSQGFLNLQSSGGFDALIWNTDFFVKRNEFNKERLEISIFPNPGSDFLYWKSDAEIKRFTIYDSMGKIYHYGVPTFGISLSNLPIGSYFIVFSDTEGKSEVLQFKKI